jgi:DNA topoisomerase-1
MHDGTHVIAGTCTTRFEGSRVTDHEQRGRVLVIVKPDNTVLVHDADGYQPIAWLTRAETVTIDGSTVVASDGDQRLEVATHQEFGSARYPTSTAGAPVGTCPDCGETLIRGNGGVRCPACEAFYGLPSDATIIEETCDCGLPRMRVERGQVFELCIDRDCESLDERVAEAFDGEWSCPACGEGLRVLRRGGLLAGCPDYPDCDTGFAIPAGTVVGECGCGLPLFETASGQRCLDAHCSHVRD